MTTKEPLSPQRKWALFRLMVIAALLNAPPRRGELHGRILELAGTIWTHPITGRPCRFAFSTIERWYYTARDEDDPLARLMRKVRSDAGTPRRLSTTHIKMLVDQYTEHPGWTYWLHHKNLVAAAEERDDFALEEVPTYSTVRRFMRLAGLHKRPKRSKRGTPGSLAAEARLEQREVRSFEVAYVGQLYHADFHVAESREFRVPLQDGAWVTPGLCAVIDDHSRMVCHAQWYLAGETTENYVHCIGQALAKRGVPRMWLHDNGGPMGAAETVSGLTRLGIETHDTLPYSPDQNGKQESFWAKIESRLMPQIESVAPHDLTLALLNETTLAFVEFEHNVEVHRETGRAPRDRFLNGPDVLRGCPPSSVLRQQFTREVRRQQRRSDGTATIDGVRFEIPSVYRHLERLTLRYARWDRSVAYLCDPREDRVLCALVPLDRQANADGKRKALRPVATGGRYQLPPGIAPHLLQLIQRLRADGLPTPYLHKD